MGFRRRGSRRKSNTDMTEDDNGIRLPELRGTYRSQLDLCNKMYQELSDRYFTDVIETNGDPATAILLPFLSDSYRPRRSHSDMRNQRAGSRALNSYDDDNSDATGEKDTDTGRLRSRRRMTPLQLCHVLRLRGKGDPRSNPNTTLSLSGRVTWHGLFDQEEKPSKDSDLFRQRSSIVVATRGLLGSDNKNESKESAKEEQKETKSRNQSSKTVRISTDDVIYRVQNWIEDSKSPTSSKRLPSVKMKSE